MKTGARSVFLGIVLATAAQARGDIQLVADINGATTGSSPAEMIGFGDLVLFRATTDGLGDELLSWNRITGVSGVVKDIVPGPESSSPRGFFEHEGRVLFVADDGTGASYLWETDGTEAGTQLVPETGAVQVVGGSPATRFAVTGDLLYFRGNAPGGPKRVHRTDGTVGGTFALDEPGFELTAVGERVFFWKNLGADLCVTEGTVPTTQCFDVASYETPEELTAAGSWLYFTLEHEFTGGRSLWRSDGTQPVEVDPALFEVSDLVAHDGYLYFAASGYSVGREVFRLDPATQAIEVAADVAAGGLGSSPRDLTPTSLGLFFAAFTSAHGDDLWLLEDTGTLTAIDVVPGSASATPESLTATDGGLVFTAFEAGVTGREPWFSDGTAGGAVLLGDLVPGSDSSDPGVLTDVGGGVAFAATDAYAGVELHMTGGTPGTTGLVADVSLDTTLSSDIEFLTEFDGRSLFLADDGVHGKELWSSDGTPGGTQLLADIEPDGDVSVSSFVEFQDRLLVAVVRPGLDQLWWTGGTPETTEPLGFAPPWPSAANSFNHLTLTSRGVLFEWSGDLWLTDGTPEETLLFVDASAYVEPRDFLEVGDRFLFRHGLGTCCSALSSTDGSSFFALSPPGVSPDVVRELEGLAYFNDWSGFGLWATDGTPEGTVVVDSDYYTQGIAVNGERLFASGHHGTRVVENGVSTLLTDLKTREPAAYLDGVAFRVYTNVSPFHRELWVSDGTVAGTRALLTGKEHIEFTVAGDTLWILAGGGSFDPDELWRSDGTSAGTSHLTTFPDVQHVTPIGEGGTVLFTAGTEPEGLEVWMANRDSLLPVLVEDYEPGPASSEPEQFLRAGANVFFTGAEQSTGAELLALPVADTGAWVLEPYGHGCPGTGALSPGLSGVGPAVLGGSFDLELEDALGGAAAALVWAPQRLAVPYGGGCSLYVGVPFSLVAVVATELDGSLSLGLPVPDEPALAGIPIHFQGLVQDPQAYLGAAATNGLEVLFGS